jgi:hypothetical protein
MWYSRTLTEEHEILFYMRCERSESSSSAFTSGIANIQYAAMRRIGHWLTTSWIERALWGVCTLGFLWLRNQIPVRDLQAIGPAALRDLAFTLILWILVLVLCISLGKRLLRIIHLEGMGDLEKGVFAFTLGFGAIAYWILLLALFQLLSVLTLTISLSAAAALLGPEATHCIKRLGALPGLFRRSWRETSTTGKVVVGVTLLIAGLSFFNALTPAWDYDGLMYHLVGPKLFLEAGKIFPFPDNWYVNGPFTIEMVFSLGLGFGDDVFPKLIHFSLGVIYILAGYILARRILNRQGAWLSLALLLGIPTLPILAGFAYIDLGWGAFEALAVLAFLAWLQHDDERWLLMSGLMCGLAMGSKYLGLMGFGLLGLILAANGLRTNLRTLFSKALWFGIPAVLLASPWYLKNVIWFGNPVFPLYFGGPGWPETRLNLYDTYLHAFGHGRSFLDTILLPLNLFLHNTQFGAVMNRIEIPNPLFLLVFIFPFLRKNRFLTMLAVISAGRFVLWAVGSQQTRFLMPIFPLLSILSVYVLQDLFSRKERFNYIPGVLCVTLMAITLYYQIVYTTVTQPLGVLLGQESKETYLLRMVNTYTGVAYARDNLPAEEQVLMLGDGRGYYCLPQCIPDPDHFRWAEEIATLDSYEDIGDWFDQKQVHYLAISREDLDFLLQHDPHGVMEKAVVWLSQWRDEGCLQEVFGSEWISIYKIMCKE